MTIQLKPRSLALALVLGTLAASSANAGLVSIVAPVEFSNSASVTDSRGGAATTNNNASMGSTELEQFDKTLGVLTGATVNLVSTRTQTTLVQSTDGADNGQSGDVTSSGTGSSTARLTIPVGVTSNFGTIIQADDCIASRTSACSGSSSANTLNTDINVSSSALNSFVGAGTVTLSRSAPTLSALQSSNAFTGEETTTTTLTWFGTLGATYTYLHHAVASFSGTDMLDVLTLDFGSVLQNSTPAQLAFSIFNMNYSGADQVGLDLDGFSASGDLSQLYFNEEMGGFWDLGAGLRQDFWASLNTTALGAFLTSYTFNLSDANVGASESRFAHSLTLNLKGSVNAANPLPANDVPEPGTLALLALGLVGVATSLRRRKV